MKRFAIPGAICVAFLFATMLPAVAQDDHPDNRNNDAHPEERHDQAQPDRQDQKRPNDSRQDQERHDQAARDEHANARRIDDAHYRAHFGADHHFAIHHVQRINGREGFSYGGYQFAFAQPWPGGWSYNDNCYIEFVDGQYYLYDLSHPGIRIMLVVL